MKTTALKNLIQVAWTAGSPVLPGCKIAPRWWANRAAWFAIGAPGAIATGLLIPKDLPAAQALLIATLFAVTLAAGMWLAETVFARRVPWHEHCDGCGVCALLVGVPGASSSGAAVQAAADHGWFMELPADGNGTAHCRSCWTFLDGIEELTPEVWR